MAEDLVVLREILQRELETINAYEKMIDRVSDPALKQIIEHVTDEEREHVAEMYQLIMERDEKQQARSLRSEQQLREMHLTGGAQRASAAAASPGHAATAAAEAGLKDPLLVPSVPSAVGAPAAVDPFPPPPPIFPDGSWSVGWLKRISPQAAGSAGAPSALFAPGTSGSGS